MGEVLQVLAAGGDISIMLILFALWKIDRRVLRIETTLEIETKDKMA